MNTIQQKSSSAILLKIKVFNIFVRELLYTFFNRNDRQYQSGANPTIASYNASVVNFYNATGSLVRFENKNIIFYF
jgi:hypothetical protein